MTVMTVILKKQLTNTEMTAFEEVQEKLYADSIMPPFIIIHISHLQKEIPCGCQMYEMGARSLQEAISSVATEPPHSK